MTKLKRIIASFLVLSQIGSVCAFATEIQTTEASTPSYIVSIPESVDFGTLNHEEENSVTYAVSVSYPGADTPSIRVTSDTEGTLFQGEHSLSFTNDLGTAILTSASPSATGTLHIDQNQVIAAEDGDYAGTVQFSIAQVSPTLSLSTSRLLMLQGGEQSVTATLVAGDGYTLSAQSSDSNVATVAMTGNSLNIRAVESDNTEDATATITVTATKTGQTTISKQIAVEVYGAEAKQVEVSAPVVEDNSVSTTVSGSAILTGDSETVTVTDQQIAIDVVTSDDNVTTAEVAISQETMQVIEEKTDSLVLKTDVGTLSMDSDALSQIVQALTESDSQSELVLAVSQAEVEVEEVVEISAVFQLEMTLDGEPISFDNGSITISVPCDDDVKWVYYVVDGVLTEQIPVTVVNGIGTFTVTHFSLWALSSEDYFATEEEDDDTTTGGSGSSGSTDTSYFLSDGYYYVDLWLWHQYADQVSMGDVAFQNNRQALVKVSNGKVTTVEIATSPVNVSGIESAVQYLEVEGQDIGYLERELFTTNTSDMTFYYIKRAEFTMPSVGQPSAKIDETYLDVRLIVPDTPMDIVAVDGYMSARFKFDWSTVVATSDKSVSQNSSMSSSALTDDEEVEEETTANIASTTITTAVKVDVYGNAVATVSHIAVSNALADLNIEVDDMEEGTLKEVRLVITSDVELTELETVIPYETIHMLHEKTDLVTLETPIATFTMDGITMATISKETTEDVQFMMALVDIPENTAEEMVALIGENPVYSFEIQSGDHQITQFDGTITVITPYTLQEDGIAQKLSVYHLSEDGAVKELDATYSAKAETLSFKTNHFSTFAVAYDENKLLFTDVAKDAWYYEAIQYVVSLGLFNGTSDTTFDPEANMTRAMIMTVLARLSGKDTSTGETWFEVGQTWSMGQGISDGTDLDGYVTREQLATMLYRHADGEPVEGDLTYFHDAHTISHWAVDAKGWAVVNGIINGKSENLLAPDANATRAEVATMIMRFAKTME